MSSPAGVVCGCSSRIHIPIVAAFAYGNAFLFTLDMVIDRGGCGEREVNMNVVSAYTGYSMAYAVSGALVTLGSSVTYAWTGGWAGTEFKFLRQLRRHSGNHAGWFVVDFAVTPVCSTRLWLQEVDCFEAWLFSLLNISGLGRFFLFAFLERFLFSQLVIAEKFGDIIVINFHSLGFSGDGGLDACSSFCIKHSFSRFLPYLGLRDLNVAVRKAGIGSDGEIWNLINAQFKIGFTLIFKDTWKLKSIFLISVPPEPSIFHSAQAYSLNNF